MVKEFTEENRMNEVEETLRVLNNSVSFHKLRLRELEEAENFINDWDFPVNHKVTIGDSLKFSKKFHNHKIISISNVRKEIMEKYNIPGEED